jgi:hypothetical protein
MYLNGMHVRKNMDLIERMKKIREKETSSISHKDDSLSTQSSLSLSTLSSLSASLSSYYQHLTSESKRIQHLELFDEFEEFNLIQAHYHLSNASKWPTVPKDDMEILSQFIKFSYLSTASQSIPSLSISTSDELHMISTPLSNYPPSLSTPYLIEFDISSFLCIHPNPPFSLLVSLSSLLISWDQLSLLSLGVSPLPFSTSHTTHQFQSQSPLSFTSHSDQINQSNVSLFSGSRSDQLNHGSFRKPQPFFLPKAD